MSLAFPAGAVGLVIAAIMAASLSSIDSAINSCTRWPWSISTTACGTGATSAPDASRRRPAHQVLVSRIATLLFGAPARRSPATCRASARCSRSTQGGQRVHRSAVRHLPAGDVQPRVAQRRRAGGRRGRRVAVSYYVAYHSGIGFMWPSTFGLAATLVVGCAGGGAHGRRRRRCARASSDLASGHGRARRGIIGGL